MDVIDVTRQSNIRMKLRDFVEYFSSPSRSSTKILNVISLEFSNTGYVATHWLAIHDVVSFKTQFVNR